MNQLNRNLFSFCLFFSQILALNLYAEDAIDKTDLKNIYEIYRISPSEINEHLLALKQLAQESASIIEINTRGSASTWALLQGLSESHSLEKAYTEIESYLPFLDKIYLSRRLARENNIKLTYINANALNVDFKDRADLLFIDSIHTYCQLTYELEKFSPQINKYIVLHDTSPPWGYENDIEYKGDYSEYPISINRTKKGLFPAITDFLAKNPEWILMDRRFNNYGLVILTRHENTGNYMKK